MSHSLVPYKVTHSRKTPRAYKFTHNFFWFKLDLLNLKSWPSGFVGINKPNLYSFYEIDHLKLGKMTALENYIEFLKKNEISIEIKKATLYTSLRFLGYVFNPVSFVIIESLDNKKYAIIEVGNTFNEQKPYFVDFSNFNQNGFKVTATKYFYISPFIAHDNKMTFHFVEKGKNVNIFIDDFNEEGTTLKVSFSGREIPATTKNLISTTLKIPFVTFKTIFLIHVHAFVLYIKGIKYFKKGEHKNLQRGTYLWKI